jgi:hypothetical protein
VAHINALSACLTAIDGIFEVFLTLDVQTIRCLPVFNFVRVAYAVVVLIKLYFAASSPKSELGKVINKENMKVEHYLDSLLEKFRATAADDRSRPAVKFLVVLVMIRSWFHKQKQSVNGGANATTLPSYSSQGCGERGSATPAPQPPPQPDYPATASTPLQLLSEVATHNSAATPTPATGGSRPSTDAGLLPTSTATSVPAAAQGPSSWLNRQPLMYDAAAPTTPASQQQQATTPAETPAANAAPFMVGVTPQQNPMASNLGPAPWLNSVFPSSADFDYDYANFGDGFAQAMDLTLGGFFDGGFGMDYAMQQPDSWYPPMGVGIDSGGGFGF